MEYWGNGGLECCKGRRIKLLIVNEKKEKTDDG